MVLAIRHFPDRKRPCITLEQGNEAIIIGTLTNAEREKALRKACNRSDDKMLGIVLDECKYTLAELLGSEG